MRTAKRRRVPSKIEKLHEEIKQVSKDLKQRIKEDPLYAQKKIKIKLKPVAAHCERSLQAYLESIKEVLAEKSEEEKFMELENFLKDGP